jgi:hypothetical protein
MSMYIKILLIFRNDLLQSIIEAHSEYSIFD